MTTFLRVRRAPLIAVIVVALLAAAGFNMQPAVLASVLLSGLTLGALYFLVTSGLSLVFGLMGVLNFAHGIIFMLGAYMGLTLYANPRTILNGLPLALALCAGLALGPVCSGALAFLPHSTNARRVRLAILAAAALTLLAFGLANFPLDKLLAQAATATGGAVPTPEAQEAVEAILGRVRLMFLAGLLASPLTFGASGPGVASRAARSLALMAVLIGSAIAVAFARAPLEQLVLSLSTDLRFVMALVFGALSGALIGAGMEYGLIRPLYSRPIYQVLLTLGLVFVGDQFIKLVWGPSGYFMEIPSLFNGQGKECPSANLVAWFGEHCASIMVLGRGFPSYRMFIIILGAVMLAAIGLLLTRTRIGMVIRAGVQDAEMVEALGINVRRVFTGVFALGAALAALGGVAAAPIIGVNPGIGQEFLLQGFISVVIGGMGSLAGAALGALLVGLGRAFGDNLVLSGVQLPWMSEAITASPAIARASTVLIMALVLLLKPSGIFGKKD